jgi:Domain of unknown function DUF29
MDVSPVVLNCDNESQYEIDYFRWLEVTVAQLRDRDLTRVDWAHLIEELEDMGRSEKRGLESNLVVLLLHLLKWQFQPEMRSGSWAGSIAEHRRRIRKSLQDSPSLLQYLETIGEECYQDARQQAHLETGLAIAVFPQDCPYAIEPLLDPNFFPTGS